MVRERKRNNGSGCDYVCESICNVELVDSGVYVRVIVRILSGPGKVTNVTVLVTPDVN